MSQIPIPSPFNIQIPNNEFASMQTDNLYWFHQIRNYPLFHLHYKKWGGSNHAKEGIVYLQNEILQALYAQQGYETSSQITISTSRDWTNFMYSGLVDEFADALKQISSLYRTEITEELFRNTKKLLIDEIINDGDYPEIIVQRVFLFFNTQQKYMKHGRISQIKSINFADIQNHWKHFMEDERGVLFTTSPQPLADLQYVFTMCEWKRMKVPPSKPPTFQINKKQSLFVGNSDVEQDHILMASDVCGIQSGDIFYALQVAVHLLGGSFDSRLSRILRIEKGLTYDVSMYIQDGLHSSLLFIQTAVEEILPSLDIIIKICKEAEKNWSDQDIEMGIFNMKYEYLSCFSTGRRSMSLFEDKYLFRTDRSNTLEDTNVSPYENIGIQDVRKALLSISQLQWFSIVLGHPRDFNSLKKRHEFVKCQEIDYM